MTLKIIEDGELIEEYIEFLEEEDENKDNILIYAEFIPETVEFLASHKRDFNRTNKDGDTALHVVISFLDEIAVSILCEYDQLIDPTIKNNLGFNVFEYLEHLTQNFSQYNRTNPILFIQNSLKGLKDLKNLEQN